MYWILGRLLIPLELVKYVVGLGGRAAMRRETIRK